MGELQYLYGVPERDKKELKKNIDRYRLPEEALVPPFFYKQRGEYFFERESPDRLMEIVVRELENLTPTIECAPEEVHRLRDKVMGNVNFAMGWYLAARCYENSPRDKERLIRNYPRDKEIIIIEMPFRNPPGDEEIIFRNPPRDEGIPIQDFAIQDFAQHLNQLADEERKENEISLADLLRTVVDRLEVINERPSVKVIPA